MTEIEAHKLSVEMWTWLADNPKLEKENWINFHAIQDLLACCYLCEFYKTYNTFNCSECCLDCLEEKSICDNYNSNLTDVKQKAAYLIRDKIKSKLEELEKQ